MHGGGGGGRLLLLRPREGQRLQGQPAVDTAAITALTAWRWQVGGPGETLWVLSIVPSQCPHFKCCQADLRHLPASSGERVCASNGLDALSPGRAAPSQASCTSAGSTSVLKGHPRPALYAAAAAAGCPRCSAREGREAGLPLGRAAGSAPAPRGWRALDSVLWQSALASTHRVQRRWRCRAGLQDQGRSLPWDTCEARSKRSW